MVKRCMESILSYIGMLTSNILTKNNIKKEGNFFFLCSITLIELNERYDIIVLGDCDGTIRIKK